MRYNYKPTTHSDRKHTIGCMFVVNKVCMCVCAGHALMIRMLGHFYRAVTVTLNRKRWTEAINDVQRYAVYNDIKQGKAANPHKNPTENVRDSNKDRRIAWRD